MRDFWRVFALSFLITFMLGYVAITAVDTIISILRSSPY